MDAGCSSMRKVTASLSVQCSEAVLLECVKSPSWECEVSFWKGLKSAADKRSYRVAAVTKIVAAMCPAKTNEINLPGVTFDAAGAKKCNGKAGNGCKRCESA